MSLFSTRFPEAVLSWKIQKSTSFGFIMRIVLDHRAMKGLAWPVINELTPDRPLPHPNRLSPRYRQSKPPLAREELSLLATWLNLLPPLVSVHPSYRPAASLLLQSAAAFLPSSLSLKVSPNQQSLTGLYLSGSAPGALYLARRFPAFNLHCKRSQAWCASSPGKGFECCLPVWLHD